MKQNHLSNGRFAPGNTIKPAKRDPDAIHRAQARARVTNGSAFLPGRIDNRSVWVRRCKDIIAEHLSDLGGRDNTSAAERSLIRRIAVMSTELERLELKFAAAGEASVTELDLYIRASGNLRRLLETIGLQRRPKALNPLPLDYAKRYRKQQPLQGDDRAGATDADLMVGISDG